ncbi:helix-turn-helix domain-containing protein [Amycolatopsis sp. NPDC005961]|uniref:TetR/AcrR family transcriptional regulator n=1 Tax=Amycolatopsis sp. NPDC005961 TaxID=3156720 RepID=UPI0033CF344E
MTPEQAPDSLIQRKQLRARQRIIDAADELFAMHGYDAVSVTDIAARAEVGRTTFFRYFGDKTEVVFAKEQALLDTIASAGADDTVGAASDHREAIEQLRPIVLRLFAQVTDDLDAYQHHTDLVEKHLELRAREALKTQQLASNLAEVLRSRGTSQTIAVFAGQIALACYETARRRARTAADLVSESSAAFDEVLTLGCS